MSEYSQRKPEILDESLNIVMMPVVREVSADLDTALSIYLKLANGPYTYLFESMEGGEKWGRYSVIGLPAQTLLRVSDNQITLTENEIIVEQHSVENPLIWIEEFAARYQIQVKEGLPRFTGGLVGYFGYDTVGYIEPRLKKPVKPDPVGTPDIFLMVSNEVVVYDNLSSKAYIIVHVHPEQKEAGEKRVDEIADQLALPVPSHAYIRGLNIEEKNFTSGFTQDGFKNAVNKVKQYIRSGDVMQVVLSQRMSIPFHARPIDLYRALRCINPSPYMYFLNMGDFHIVGSSPEILSRLEASEVTVRPIAGTRPRGKTSEEDATLETDLLADPKERAEHLMLIDLGRNDVGRISQAGSVRVTQSMAVEYYSHVMHIVSNICGILKKNMSAMDVYRATFPAGTVSGAPKIRAMEIIDELEPVKRGIYAGAVGYFSWNGNMDTAITIRTAVIKDSVLYIQAGAGIVSDSVPDKEWDETLNKARAIFRAARMAESGLDISFM